VIKSVDSPPAGTDARSYWDGEAGTFDDEPDHGLRDPRVRSAWSRLLLPLMPKAAARVADLGSGTGSLALLLAAAGHEVRGLDIAPRMVEAARMKAARSRVHADFDLGDAAEPPWPPASFDVVLVRHVLWAMADPGAALARWLELLSLDGRLVLIEGRWSTGVGLTAVQARQLVLRQRAEAIVTTLDDPNLWGRPVEDERYMLVSAR
jgi:SAM-dependent methyltransferase